MISERKIYVSGDGWCSHVRLNGEFLSRKLEWLCWHYPGMAHVRVRRYQCSGYMHQLFFGQFVSQTFKFFQVPQVGGYPSEGLDVVVCVRLQVLMFNYRSCNRPLRHSNIPFGSIWRRSKSSTAATDLKTVSLGSANLNGCIPSFPSLLFAE